MPMKLNLPFDGANTPKKKLIADLTAYFSAYDLISVKEFLADDVVWTLVGEQPIHGKANFLAALQEMSEVKATELTIHQIITHGREAAVSGQMMMEDGKSYGFSDFYVFASAGSKMVKSIRSYVILLK